MRFMNDYEIADAVNRWADHPVLGPASRTLASLADAADRNSDGWAYWPKPARAASRLMELIQRDGTYQYFSGDRPDVTVAEYRKAIAPVKAFRTRSGLSFEVFEAERRESDMTYRIVRIYANDDYPKETITTGLTLAQARKHCHDPETSSRTAKHQLAVERTGRYGEWFDAFEEET